MVITNIYKGALERSDIRKIYKGSTLLYESVPQGENYVRFVSAGARTITPKYTNSGVTLEYSVNGGKTWTTIASDASTTSATEHWFRGQATGTKSLFTSSGGSAWAFSGSSDLEVYGNLNYLLCDTLGDEVAPTALGTYCYNSMFNGCTALTVAPELPATSLANYCYQYMFDGCTSLTTAPELPATTLAWSCYATMFNKCTSLTTAPELPATTLANYCYNYMFNKCTSLTTAPELPATTTEVNCYANMFRDCTSFKVSATQTGAYIYPWRIPTSGTGVQKPDWNTLMLSGTGGTFTSDPSINTTYYVENQPINQPVSPATVVRFVSAEARTIRPRYTNSGVTLQYSIDKGKTWTTIASESETTSATEHWFRGQATGTKSLFTSAISSNTWAFSGSSDLEVYGNLNFLLCDTLGDEVAPTSLGNYAYAHMFRGCTSLTTPPELHATTLGTHAYASMFYGCTSLTTAPELPAATLANYCYQYMFNGCTSLTTAPELPATTLAEGCYRNMFYRCTSLTKAPALPATTLASICYSQMFDSCTSLTTAPKLPATTLASSCYSSMFRDCTSFKVSSTNTGSYIYTWRIPTSGSASTATNWNLSMLRDTGGTFKSNPTINTTYYVENQPV